MAGVTHWLGDSIQSGGSGRVYFVDGGALQVVGVTQGHGGPDAASRTCAVRVEAGRCLLRAGFHEVSGGDWGAGSSSRLGMWWGWW